MADSFIPLVPPLQPPRSLTGREIERLCHHGPAAAARIAVDLVHGRIALTRPTADQAARLTGASATDYCAANALIRRTMS
jgi:hypothetical protein